VIPNSRLAGWNEEEDVNFMPEEDGQCKWDVTLLRVRLTVLPH
jgi:hypothetical protein